MMDNFATTESSDELKSRIERRAGSHGTVPESIVRHESPADIISEDDLLAPESILRLDECMNIFEVEPLRKLEAIKSIRRLSLLSCLPRTPPSSSSPVDDIVECGALLHLVRALDPKECDEIRLHATAALANICYEHPNDVVSLGALSKLVSLLDHEESVASTAFRALDIILIKCPDRINLAIASGIMPKILNLCRKPISLEFRRIIFTLLTRSYKNGIPENDTASFLDILSEFLDYKHGIFCCRACNAIGRHLAHRAPNATSIISPTAVQKVLDCLNSQDMDILTVTLNCLGFIAMHDHNQVVIDSKALGDVLDVVERIEVSSDKNKIILETMWLLSNLVAKNHDQVQCVLDAGAVPFLLETLKTGSQRFKQQACVVIDNLLACGSLPQISFVLEKCDRVVYDLLANLSKCFASNTLDNLMKASGRIRQSE